MLSLTVEQHQQVVRRLCDLAQNRTDKIPSHAEGFEYTSLMTCFLLHNLASTEVLLRLVSSFGNDWFPVTVGYTIARTMFETDVTAHYITQNPKERVRQYIDFGAVLNKRKMDAYSKHRNSKNLGWHEAMSLVWDNHWASREHDVNNEFNAVAPKFTRIDQKGKQTVFQNWSGKTLRQMATEVDHTEAYDIFYTELSSFTHVNVHLADRFLHLQPNGPTWSMRADELDVGNVFRHAASFLTCYLELFGHQFNTWSKTEVDNCWKVKPETK